MKVKLFSYLIGGNGRGLCETLEGDIPVENRTVTMLLTKFDEHCNPSVNETVERYRFFTRNQGASESINVTKLRVLARTCNFGDIRESLIRGSIVCRINSTDWISSILSVQKLNGKPRICIDPQPLNKALKQSHFPLLTVDDILPDLSKAKVFTVCDVEWFLACQTGGRVQLPDNV